METRDKPPYGSENPDNPLPDNLKTMITYNKDDSFVKPADVVHFLMHEEEELAIEVESEREEIQQTVSNSYTVLHVALLTGWWWWL